MTFHYQSAGCILLAFVFAARGAVAGAADGFPTVAALPELTTLPDPLCDDHGRPITNPTRWIAQREWMKAVIAHYELGRSPPSPGNISVEVAREQTVLDGKGIYRLIGLTFGPGKRLHLQAALFLPGDGQGRYPTIILPNFGRTPGGDPTPGVPAPATGQHADSPGFRADYAAPILERGYALLTYDYQQAGLDRANNRDSGFFPAYPDYDWGTEAAWAWGLSRAVDYLESQPFVDKARIIAVGHSRLGKLALIAGAFDERIALSVPAGSGTGGTAAYRFTGAERGGKEGLDHIVHAFPHWFIPRLAEFVGQVDKLPFDAHWLIALTAPRPLLVEDGLDDPNVNLNAVVQSYRAAKPVYAMLGAADRLGIFVRPGGHHLQAEDWSIILDFADRELRRLPSVRKFDQLPDSSAAKAPDAN